MPIKIFLYLFCLLFISSCATLKPVDVTKKGNINDYKFVYISKIKNISSSATGSNYYYTYGYTDSINPVDIIAGKFMKKGIVIVNNIKEPEKTLIVNYAESGRREILNGFAGDAVEISIQVINAASSDIVYLCSAEGQGEMLTDNVRQAIDRCLEQL